MGGKLLSGIKSTYVDSLTCIRLKVGESERFRIDSGVDKKEKAVREESWGKEFVVKKMEK